MFVPGSFNLGQAVVTIFGQATLEEMMEEEGTTTTMNTMEEGVKKVMEDLPAPGINYPKMISVQHMK